MCLSCRQFKTYNESEVWEALTSQAREDETLEEPITVKQIAESWIKKDRFPVVSVTRDYEDNSAYVEQVGASISC
jgi:aminopeptidase N